MAEVVQFPNKPVTVDELIEFLQDLRQGDNVLRSVAVVYELQNGNINLVLANMSAGALAFGALLMQLESLDVGETGEDYIHD